jgi:hypothetical protein
MPRSRHRKKKPARTRGARRYIVDEELGLYSPPEEKMSGVLLEFLKPYRRLADDDAALGKLVALGIVAWNVALLPEAERDAAIEKFAVAAFGPRRATWLGRLRDWVGARVGREPSASDEVESREHRDFKATIREMVDRKQQVFPGNHRFILDYTLSCDDDDVQLFVVSTLERPRL